jgi:lipoate-protein ligase A
MAIDRWMLQQLLAGGAPMLRLYRWRVPTLSLGRHQQRWPEHWLELQRQGRIALVRRPSGGRAVLHAGELTYALVQHPPERGREQAYRQACLWLQHAFRALGEPLHFGVAAAAAAQQRSSCFASATAADLVNATGAKRIGSAQLWRGPALLQHGSVLLDPPRELWLEVFGEAPPPLGPLPCTGLELEQTLKHAAQQALCHSGLEEQPLSPAEWSAVQQLIDAQASPLASIARATGASPIPKG